MNRQLAYKATSATPQVCPVALKVSSLQIDLGEMIPGPLTVSAYIYYKD